MVNKNPAGPAGRTPAGPVSRKQTGGGNNSLLGLQIAVGLVVAALFIQGATTTYYYRLEKKNLEIELQNKINAVEESKKARLQLEAIAGKTAKLAQDGNKSAAIIIERFKAAGITIKAPAPQ